MLAFCLLYKVAGVKEWVLPDTGGDWKKPWRWHAVATPRPLRKRREGCKWFAIDLDFIFPLNGDGLPKKRVVRLPTLPLICECRWTMC
jgi:hypothetical protein